MTTTRSERDQLWVINSPEFFQLEGLEGLEEVESAQRLLNSSSPGSNFIASSTHRLGVYFEQLWNFLITNTPSLELLEHNLQVIINKKTLGEFDAIVLDKASQKTCHCELAVKFYLQIGNGKLLSDWVGPNLKDRFDSKFLRLFEHQLLLSKVPLVGDWLERRDIYIDKISLLTKGRLFYPYEKFLAKQFVFPNQVNPVHGKGFWLTYSQWNTVLSSTNYDWYQLPRMYWLAAVTKDDISSLKEVTLEHKCYSFQENSLQKVVAMQDGKEIMRGFIVTNEWLDKAKIRVS